MRFSKHNEGEDQGGPDMAPMVDVCFLMLIFFMVASVFAQFERNLSITVPKSTLEEKIDRFPGEIIINVDKEGRLMINNVSRSYEELDATLADIAEIYTGQPVIVRQDEGSEYRYFVKVYDLCRKHSIENIRIATMSEKKK